MSDRYEIMTLVDAAGDERGAVIVETATEQMLSLGVFQDDADAEAFIVWLETKYGTGINDSLLRWKYDQWIKAKQQSAVAAYKEAMIDV